MENYDRAFRDPKSPLTPLPALVRQNKFNFTEPSNETTEPTRKRAALTALDINENCEELWRKAKSEVIETELTYCTFVVPPMVAIPKIVLNLPDAAKCKYINKQYSAILSWAFCQAASNLTVSKEKTSNNNKIESENDEDEDDEEEDQHDSDTSYKFDEEVEQEEEEEEDDDEDADIAVEVEERDFINDEEEEEEEETDSDEDDTSDDPEEEEDQNVATDLHKYATRFRWENSYYRLLRRNRAQQFLAPRGCPTIASIFGTEQLSKYLEIFNREEIDIDVLRIMIDDDFHLVGLEAHDIQLIREAVSKHFS